jgi:hypothetical protein
MIDVKVYLNHDYKMRIDLVDSKCKNFLQKVMMKKLELISIKSLSFTNYNINDNDTEMNKRLTSFANN